MKVNPTPVGITNDGKANPNHARARIQDKCGVDFDADYACILVFLNSCPFADAVGNLLSLNPGHQVKALAANAVQGTYYFIVVPPHNPNVFQKQSAKIYTQAPTHPQVGPKAEVELSDRDDELYQRQLALVDRMETNIEEYEALTDRLEAVCYRLEALADPQDIIIDP